MLEQIFDLVKQYGQQSVVDNPEVPNELNNQVLNEATHTITGGLQNVLSGGGLQNLIGMFYGGQNQNSGSILNNPIVAGIVSQLAGNLISKFNLNPAVANSVANNLIPGVMHSLVNRTVSNAPQDGGFNLTNLISTLTGASGGGGFDFQNLLNQFAGGEQVDPNVANQVAQQAQQHQQGGGLADLIQGFFK